jgi:hypothetical protein
MTSTLPSFLASIRQLTHSLSAGHRLSGFFARHEPVGDERYLADAADMGDLERRIRQLERGTVQSANTQLSMMSWGH